MDILFIGGSGIISSACSRVAVEAGHQLFLLNRGQTTSRPVPNGATPLHGDIRDPASAAAALGSRRFDAVVNWVAFTPEHIETDLALFRDRTDQYIFISSASAYQTPPERLPVLESTPLRNPYWRYSRDKIACEERLTRAYREDGFPTTIVRPSHTYDQTLLPMDGGYTVVDRMRRGQPVIVHGDGTSLWTLTHHQDFAAAFTGLLGNPQAVGDVFHITSDEWLSWNQIFETVARAAGTQAELVHVPSEVIAAFDADRGAGLLGDKAHSMVFDNTKIKRAVPGFEAKIPFARGAQEIMAWYDADPARQVVDQQLNHLMDTIIAAQQGVRP
ncbi:SDR family oxidoreductase [Deinococcus alpinitundrae]|uniref:SDR family oxidoreductase n=1 Tax=Deinococcus alpinitundrae TaxID=468913 RepID=UPI00137B416D|nr:SDR family oxidoreductase [Deinococcus alpinitundrae]